MIVLDLPPAGFVIRLCVVWADCVKEERPPAPMSKLPRFEGEAYGCRENGAPPVEIQVQATEPGRR